MPLTLVRRSGSDTLGVLEAAARSRFREAESLHSADQRLGAVYLYGYVIEITLKTAYYRVIGLIPSTVINKHLHRFPAEDAIKHMAGLPAHPQGAALAGHNVVGWARLLEQERAKSLRGRTPLDPQFARQLHDRMLDVFACWAEFLRYRANRPYHEEVETLRNSARWVRRHYRRLWS